MPGIRDRGQYWQVWWIVKKKRYWAKLSKKIYPKKKDAQKEAFRRELDEEDAVKKKWSFKDFSYSYLEEKRPSVQSFEKYDKLVRDFTDFISNGALSSVTETVVYKYISQKQASYKAASINRDITYLKQIFNSAVEKGIIPRSPLKSIKSLEVKKDIKVLPTKEERENILGWFRRKEPLFYAWLYFEITRGWRMNELRNLRVEDVDISSNTLYIKKTKTKTQRLTKLSHEDCLVLNEHMLLLKRKKLYSPEGYLFPSRAGGLTGRNTLLRKIKRGCRELGIRKNITNHLFRHYVVTTILDRTANIEVVKAITGHKDTKTILEHYAHATSENIKRGLEITKVSTGLHRK
ncbi:MAG: site-specific integrase [Candidatus Omnitrophica bacterium]|nr:site-specific integrase [Candidatus Omnitrophota bacterium]